MLEGPAAILARLSSGTPLLSLDGKTGSQLTRVQAEGRTFVVKHLRRQDDWLMQVSGDLTCRPLVLWRSGLLTRMPQCIDHATLGCVPGQTLGEAQLIMEDVGAYLVAEGDAPIPVEQHLRFLDHMAALHAAFWDWEDRIGLLPLSSRLLLFHPSSMAAAGDLPGAEVPRLAVEGWARFADRAPRAARIVCPLLDDPTPLIAALASTPRTLVHGDWKLGNLGTRPDGRTILLDWALPGSAPPALDLAWYLALNRSRLPHDKDDAIAAYADALVRHGIALGSWWLQQLDLALLVGLVWFGWEKALGDAAELGWWEERALRGAAWLAKA
ncbi:MAG TPA: phosphotransferase [Chloroflexota bacterium]|nr:phosphotransferase [Chloroflexota bacterium]